MEHVNKRARASIEHCSGNLEVGKRKRIHVYDMHIVHVHVHVCVHIVLHIHVHEITCV